MPEKSKVRRPAKPKLSTPYFPALTGLRAFACALVFAHHYYAQWIGNLDPHYSFIREGYIGVTIFFTLSGFLITQTYFLRFAKKSVTFFDYWFRRFARIYPTYITLVLCKVFWLTNPYPDPLQLLTASTLTQAYFEPYLWTGLSVGWSLTVEEAFYILAGPLFLTLSACQKRGASITSRVPNIWRGATLLLGSSVALFVLGNFIRGLRLGKGFLATQHMVSIYSIFGRFPEFAVGILLALILIKNPARLLKKTPLFSELVFFTSLAGILGSLLYGDRLRVLGHSTYGIYTESGITLYWFCALATGGIIWSILSGSSLASWLLGNRVSEYLGRISYAAYLLQDGPHAEQIFIWIDRYTSLGSKNFIAAYAALNLFAALLYETLEKPIHRWLLQKTT